MQRAGQKLLGMERPVTSNHHYYSKIKKRRLISQKSPFLFKEGIMEEQGIRINKYLSEAGVCSRREADRQVEAGNVTIDGQVAETERGCFPGSGCA